MRRISAIATIRDAYGFTIAHLGDIIGLIWVPMVLGTVMGFFSLQRYYADFSAALVSNNMAALAPSALMMLCCLVAEFLLLAMMCVATVQLALGARAPAAVAHFAFGNPEWRMFRAIAGLWLMAVLPVFVIGGAVFKAAGVQADAAQLGVLFYVVILLALPRFFLLLPAIAVGENAPVLRRAWMMSAGNFWRLLLVLLAIFGPVFVLLIGADMVLMGQDLVLSGDEQQQMRTVISRLRATLPLISGLWFLVSPLVVGLLAGASVSAWRALKDEPAALDIAV